MADVPPKRAGGPTADGDERGAVAAADLAGDLPRNPGSDQGGGLYRLLVESVRDYAIFALDTTGHVLSWNPGAERFKGYKAHEIIGKHFSVFYPEEDKAKPAHELEVAAIEGRFEDEGWRLRKDGTRFWANVVITALRNERGQLVGYAKVTRDLTERKAAEDRERESVRRAAQSEEASRAKTGFLAAMSHELRTPLNAMAGYADLLLAGVSGTLGPQQREYLERIRRSQQHLLSIINDILNFMRVDAGHVQYDVAPLSLRAICATVVQMIEPQALNKQIRVTPWAGPDVVAYADRAKVEQIVLNLLSNAVKFTEHGGRIVVVCATRGEEALLQVTDTGIGIPAEQLEAIFQPFVQVGRSLTSHHEGTGLGLAISSDMAIAMRGTLSVESTVGEGSTFTLSLPGKPPAAGDAA